MGVETFIARQPIFDGGLDVYGYELLHRSGWTQSFDCPSPDRATVELMNTSLLLNRFQELTDGKLGFVNVTRNLLVQDVLQVLPRDFVVIEILETVEPDAEVVEAVRRLKDAGHRFALDDFVYRPEHEAFLELADIVKVDFLATTLEERRELLARVEPHGPVLLAEKIETREELQEARDLGFELFQGFFFCEPETLSQRDLPKRKVGYLELLQELSRSELRLDRVEEIIKREMSLSAKLLRYLNSAAFGVRAEITSIRQALTHLGERPLKRWGNLIALSGLGEDKPLEIVRTCMVRARFCESLAGSTGRGEHELDHYLTGMFSAIDALLDRPLADALREIGLKESIQRAIEGDDSSLGRAFALATACERGDFAAFVNLAKGFGLHVEGVAEMYAKALFWADSIFDQNAGDARAA